MTHDEIAELMEDELRTKVAEIVGWTRLGVCGQPDYGQSPNGDFGVCADYPNDLDAVWRFAERWASDHDFNLHLATDYEDEKVEAVIDGYDVEDEPLYFVAIGNVDDAPEATLICRVLIKANEKVKETA